MNIPRDLEELLACVKDIKVDNIEETIGKNVWTKRFSDYLIKRGLEDDLQCLRFLLKMQLLLTLDRKIDKDKSGVGKTVTQWRKDRAVIFRKILVAHFNDDEDILPMANGDLQEALCQWTRDPGKHVHWSSFGQVLCVCSSYRQSCDRERFGQPEKSTGRQFNFVRWTRTQIHGFCAPSS